MVWLRNKKNVLYCTLIWRRSLISAYVNVVYFISIFESKHIREQLIRDFNIKILNLSMVSGSSLTCGTALCPSARHINICLELVQPRKTHPNITEKLLTG